MQGLVYALIAAVLYGVQYTPVKAYAIYDGSKFQWLMSCGIAFSGLVAALLSGVPRLVVIHHGLVGGTLWGTANVLVLPTVKFLGLGVGFAMYHSINMAVGYSLGRFGLLGAPKEIAKNATCRDGGLGLLILSLMAMIFVEPEIDQPEMPPQKHLHRAGSMSQFLGFQKPPTTEQARVKKSKMDLLLDAAALKRRPSSSQRSSSASSQAPSLVMTTGTRRWWPPKKGRHSLSAVEQQQKEPPTAAPAATTGMPRPLSVDQLDELEVNAGAKMAREAYGNWRRGMPRGSVEKSSGIVGAKTRATRDQVMRRMAASREFWPLFSAKDQATVRSRYRGMPSSVQGDDLRTTLRALMPKPQSKETDTLLHRVAFSERDLEASYDSLLPSSDSYVKPPPPYDEAVMAAAFKEAADVQKRRRFLIGGICGCLAGILCGLNMLPYVVFIKHHGGHLSWNLQVSFIFSQCIGVFLAATFLFGFFAVAARALDIELKSPAVW